MATSPGRNSCGYTSKAQVAEITSKLEEIKKKKAALNVSHSSSHVLKGDHIPSDYSKRPKKLFSHPKLEHVYGEIVFSPYTVSPIDSYPAEIYTVHKKLRDLRVEEAKAKGLPEGTEKPNLELPYDVRKTKNEFIKVVNYKPKYGKCKDKVEGYHSDYGVLATSRVVEPGSTMASLVNPDSAFNKFKELRKQRAEVSKSLKYKKSLQYLCSLQPGGPEKFRSRIKNAKSQMHQVLSSGKFENKSSEVNGAAPALIAESQVSEVLTKTTLDGYESEVLRSLTAAAIKRAKSPTLAHSLNSSKVLSVPPSPPKRIASKTTNKKSSKKLPPLADADSKATSEKIKNGDSGAKRAYKVESKAFEKKMDGPEVIESKATKEEREAKEEDLGYGDDDFDEPSAAKEEDMGYNEEFEEESVAVDKQEKPTEAVTLAQASEPYIDDFVSTSPPRAVSGFGEPVPDDVDAVDEESIGKGYDEDFDS